MRSSLDELWSNPLPLLSDAIVMCDFLLSHVLTRGAQSCARCILYPFSQSDNVSNACSRDLLSPRLLLRSSLTNARHQDFSDAKLYVGPCFLYIFYGMYDAFWQGFTYWLLGALCNTPKEAARFVAVYKTMQSVGGAVAYRLTANHLSARKQ